MKVAAIIQCTPEDLAGTLDPRDYCVAACKECGLFDDVIIACPAGDNVGRLTEAANQWGIKIFVGSELNVAQRLVDAAHHVEADVMIRLLLGQFYLDTDQLTHMAKAVSEFNADYVSMPSDYNYALVGDVSTVEAMDKALSHINQIASEQDRYSFYFSPWVFMEGRPDLFKVVTVGHGPEYSKEKVRSIKEKYKKLFGQNHVHFKWNYPASSYGFVGKYLTKHDTVLDIACGKGQGTRRLRECCGRAIGVDMDENYIERARLDHAELPEIDFELGDAETYVKTGYYSAVVSLHTLEHLERPEEFMQCTRRNLCDNGKLLLEVPLLLKHPMGEPLMPWHLKEYLLDELVDFVADHGFQIDDVWGKNRHTFTHIERNGIGGVVNPEERLTSGTIISHKIN